MGKVLDISNWDWTVDRLNPNWAKCLKDAGVTGVILGCQDPAIARLQAKGLIAEGIQILALYGFNYFTAGPAVGNGDILDAVVIAGELNVHRIYIDCEIDNTPDDPADRNAEVAICELHIQDAGYEAAIYTAAWWWAPNHANTTQFAHLPLWFASYGPNDGTLQPIHEVDFGGWTKPVIHQYTSTLQICGRGRDANYVFEEEEEMTPLQIARLERVERILAGNGIDTDDDGKVDKTGEEALAHADKQGWSAFYGVSLARQEAADAAAHNDGDGVLAPGTKLVVVQS